MPKNNVYESREIPEPSQMIKVKASKLRSLGFQKSEVITLHLMAQEYVNSKAISEIVGRTPKTTVNIIFSITQKLRDLGHEVNSRTQIIPTLIENGYATLVDTPQKELDIEESIKQIGEEYDTVEKPVIAENMVQIQIDPRQVLANEYGLQPRELEVLQTIANGDVMHEKIAEKLRISRGTVKNHLENIRSKFEAFHLEKTDVSGLILVLIQYGLAIPIAEGTALSTFANRQRDTSLTVGRQYDISFPDDSVLLDLGFTNQEIILLKLIATGVNSDSDQANALTISGRTLSNHITNIRKKFEDFGIRDLDKSGFVLELLKRGYLAIVPRRDDTD